MINNDRIVPITRTDLLSFFAAIYNATVEGGITILPVSDGAVELPADANGAYLAAEPLKTLPEVEAGTALFFVPAYDFEMTMTPGVGAPEFVANPGNLYRLTSAGTVQLDTYAAYTPSEGEGEGGSGGDNPK